MIAGVVKSTLIPGSLPFLLVALGCGVLLLHAGRWGQRLGRGWLTAVGVLYLVLSIPLVSNALIAGLEPPFAAPTDEETREARAVVVIGNGIVRYGSSAQAIHQLARRTAFAVLETVRIYELIHPAWVIASGGTPDVTSQSKPESEVMRDELTRLGIPPAQIILESGSRNTAEQIANIASLLREKQIAGTVVIVTTPAHARRVELLARQHGLRFVLGVATELRYDEDRHGLWLLVPSVSALRGSETAMYEYFAVVNAWITGSTT